MDNGSYTAADIEVIVRARRTLPGLTERETRLVWRFAIGLPATAPEQEKHDLENVRPFYETALRKLDPRQQAA